MFSRYKSLLGSNFHFCVSRFKFSGRPPSCISIFSHNFGVDQHFCAKFGTVIENRQPKGRSAQKSDFRKSKMAEIIFKFETDGSSS